MKTKETFKVLKREKPQILRRPSKDSFIDVCRLLSSVDYESWDSELNEKSISDGSGGRILL